MLKRTGSSCQVRALIRSHLEASKLACYCSMDTGRDMKLRQRFHHSQLSKQHEHHVGDGFLCPQVPCGSGRTAQRDSWTQSRLCYRRGALSVGILLLYPDSKQTHTLVPRGRHYLNPQGCLLQMQLLEMNEVKSSLGLELFKPARCGNLKEPWKCLNT